jgi:hypothetical protein
MHALDTIIGFITQSAPIYLFEKNIQTKISQLTTQKIMGLGDEMASPLYQELGQEAQHALEISPERHVPIKQIPSTSIMANYVGAVAEPDAIYVNEEKLNQRTYGMQRCAMFHEAVHKKYNDPSADTIIELVALVGGLFAAYKLIGYVKPAGQYKMLHGICTLIAGISTANIASAQYHQFIEKRADTEGHYATQCYLCVQESAARRQITFEQENNPLKNNGYLWATDLEKIAHNLETENKICAYHQKNL